MVSQTATSSHSSSKKTAGIVLGAVAAIALAVAARAVYYSLEGSCSDPFHSSDPPSVTTVESHDLLAATRAAMQNDPLAPSSWPLKVIGIKGRTASLSVLQPLYVGDNRYARVWQQVYAKSHGGRIVCVHLHLFWKGGDVLQYFSVGPPL